MSKTGKTILLLAILLAYLACSLGLGDVLVQEESVPAYSALAGPRISVATGVYQDPVAIVTVRTEVAAEDLGRYFPCVFGAIVALLLGAGHALFQACISKLITRKEFCSSILSTFLGGVSPPVYSF